MSEKKVRVLIAEDHGTMRAGLRLLVEREPDMECVGEAADAAQKISLSRYTSRLSGSDSSSVDVTGT